MRKLITKSWFKVPSMHLLDIRFKRLGYLLQSIIITILSILLSHFIIHDFESLSAFASSKSSADFEMSDIYNMVSNQRKVSIASPHVTVVAADECSRQELLDLLELVSEYEPKAIGLDIFFRNAENDSTMVLEALQSTPNLVLPCKLQPTETGEYERIFYSFVEEKLDANYAYVNLNASSTQDVVREFTPMTPIFPRDTLLHITTAMAEMVAPEQYDILRKRNKKTETIKYSSIEIPIIHAHEILQSHNYDYLSRHLTRRAVLIGDINNLNDMYSTPLKGLTPGVLIHAYALNTIITEAYTGVSPSWLNWMIAIFVCVLFIYANILIKERWSHIGNLLMRVLQIALMFGMVLLGAYWYNQHMQYIDFSPVILMIGFSALAGDVYDGCYAIYLQINKLIKKRR